MSAGKFHEPALADPRDLEPGDLVACLDAGTGMRLATTLVGDDQCDLWWFALLNRPAETTHIYDWPVPQGSTALQLGETSWKSMPLPQVLARRQVAP